MSIAIQLTEHPYVVRHPGIGNGEPITYADFPDELGVLIHRFGGYRS